MIEPHPSQAGRLRWRLDEAGELNMSEQRLA